MAIKTTTCFNTACDVCGDELDDGDGIKHFATPADALAYLRDLDCWWVGPDEAVVCELRTPEHLSRAREIAGSVRSEKDRAQFVSMWPEIDLAEFGPRFADAMPGQSVIDGEL